MRAGKHELHSSLVLSFKYKWPAWPGFRDHLTNDITQNLNPIKKSSYYNSYCYFQIATNFCTCHDSCAVVACAKIYSNHFNVYVDMRQIYFYWLWITKFKFVVKQAPGLDHGLVSLKDCEIKLLGKNYFPHISQINMRSCYHDICVQYCNDSHIYI